MKKMKGEDDDDDDDEESHDEESHDEESHDEESHDEESHDEESHDEEDKKEEEKEEKEEKKEKEKKDKKEKKKKKKRPIPEWMKLQIELQKRIREKEKISRVPEVAKRTKQVVKDSIGGDYKEMNMTYVEALTKTLEKYN
jgi:ribonuclease E